MKTLMLGKWKHVYCLKLDNTWGVLVHVGHKVIALRRDVGRLLLPIKQVADF